MNLSSRVDGVQVHLGDLIVRKLARGSQTVVLASSVVQKFRRARVSDCFFVWLPFLMKLATNLIVVIILTCESAYRADGVTYTKEKSFNWL